MTDPDLIAKKLAVIETCVSDLRRLARPAELSSDVRERRFVEHTLQIAIQAALDVASHIVSDERLGEPRTSRELFDLLGHADWVPSPGRHHVDRFRCDTGSQRRSTMLGSDCHERRGHD